MTLETVTIDRSNETPNPSLEEQAAKMGINPAEIDATAQEQMAPPPKPEIPEYVPEKFRNADDPLKAMADAYAALEKKLGAGQQEEQVTTEDEPVVEDVADPGEQAAKQVADKAGLDLNELSNKYWEKGTIDDGDYESLEKIGVTRTVVDQFIAGQVALRNAARNEAFSVAGGEDTYWAMTEWAGENLPAAEVNAYNKAVESQDPAARKMAIAGLKARYDAQVGREPRQVTGGGSVSEPSKYESVAQVMEDMRNPKYKVDPAFRSRVADKLARSDVM